MAITDLRMAWDKYQEMFGENPPVFGYEDEEILPAINKAIETKKLMPGKDEIIEKELGVSEQEKADGKGIIL